MIKILIADDSVLFRSALALLLSEDKNLIVNGKVGSGEAVLDHLDENPDTDIVIMDIRLDGLDGIETTKKIIEENRKAKVIIFTMNPGNALVQGLTAGAKGILTKDAAQEELFSSIYAVNEGKTYLQGDMIDDLVQSLMHTMHMVKKITANRKAHEDFFTPKEKEVLYSLTEGLTSKEIAEKLSLSVRTVENHKFNMMTKANVKNVLSLLAFAYEKGIITLIEEESKSPKDTNSGESVS